MDWVTVNDHHPQDGTGEDSIGSVTSPAIVAHEIYEDAARKEYDEALQTMSQGNYFEAKKRFEKLATRDLPDTPFRARLFRATWKNLARCHLVVEDAHNAMQALVQATTYLERDDQDISLWMMLRRTAREARHGPVFRLTDAVLAEIAPAEEYIEMPFPTDYRDEERTQLNAVDINFPKSVSVVIPRIDDLTWDKLVEIVTTVDLDENVDFAWFNRPKSTETSSGAVHNDPDENKEMDVVEGRLQDNEPMPLDTPHDAAQTPPPDSEAQQNSVSPSSQQTPTKKRRRDKGREHVPRLTKRQLMRISSVEEPQEEPAQENEEDLVAEDVLPALNLLRWQELYSWFDARSSDESNLVLRNTTPANSPIMARSAAMTTEQASECLRATVHELQEKGTLTGFALFKLVYSIMFRNFSVIPARVIADMFKEIVSHGIPLTDEEYWLGKLCELESTDTFENLTPTEIMETEANMHSEMSVLENALERDNYELASRTLRRCVERARLMKRPLLARLALDRLEQFNQTDDLAFIAHQRERLERSSAHERIDTALDECAVHSSAFIKDPEGCLRRVHRVCKEEHRPKVFQRYRLDALKHGVVTRDEHVCRAALFHFMDSEMDERAAEVSADHNEVDAVEENNGIRITPEEVEAVFCRIARVFPSLLTPYVTEAAMEGLWPRLLPAFWVWVNESSVVAAAAGLDFLKGLGEEDYASVSAESDRVCILHAMYQLNAYRSALILLKQMGEVSPNADWIDRRIDQCKLAIMKDSTSADVALQLLLHDPSVTNFFLSKPEQASGIKLAAEDSYQEESSSEASILTMADLTYKREEVMDQCATILWGSATFNQEDIPLLWEFLAPHLWASGVSGVGTIQKKTYLHKLLQSVWNSSPATWQIAQLEAGAFWYHLVVIDEPRAEWLERDLRAEQTDRPNEPRRLQALFMMAKARYNAKDLEACQNYLAEIERLVERRYPVSLKPGALVQILTPLLAAGDSTTHPVQAIAARTYPLPEKPALVDLLLLDPDHEVVCRAVPSEFVRVVPHSLMADVLPEDLDRFLIDVNEYLTLARSAQNDPELDNGVDASIALCEKIDDERLWSFHWIKGLVSGDEKEERKCYARAKSIVEQLLAKKANEKKRKGATKGYNLVLASLKVALSDVETRLCELDMKGDVETMTEEERKSSVDRLERALEQDLSNLYAARLLQELQGNESKILETTFFKCLKNYWRTEKGSWRTNFFLFDEICMRERDEEMMKALDCLLRVLKHRPDPIPTILAVLDQYRLKHLKEGQETVFKFVLDELLPRLDLENTYVVNLTMKQHSLLRKKSDTRLMDLGQQEFGSHLNFLEVLEACKSKWKKHFEQHRTSKLFKPMAAIGTSGTSVPASGAEASVNASLTAGVASSEGGDTVPMDVDLDQQQPEASKDDTVDDETRDDL